MAGKIHRLEPGTHRVTCRYQGGGPHFDRNITLKPGQRLTLRSPPVQVRLDLRLGDAASFDGKILRGDARMLPKRYRVELLRGGEVLEARYVTVTHRGCTLVDTPNLGCR